MPFILRLYRGWGFDLFSRRGDSSSPPLPGAALPALVLGTTLGVIAMECGAATPPRRGIVKIAQRLGAGKNGRNGTSPGRTARILTQFFQLSSNPLSQKPFPQLSPLQVHLTLLPTSAILSTSCIAQGYTSLRDASQPIDRKSTRL